MSTDGAAAEQLSGFNDVRGAAVQRMLSNAASHGIHAQAEAVPKKATEQRVKRVCALTKQHYPNLIAGALHDTVLYHRGDCVTGEINVILHCDTAVDEKDARFLARCHSASPAGSKGGRWIKGAKISKRPSA
eukprot:3797-Heterococcus_DN1.PRE.2